MCVFFLNAKNIKKTPKELRHRLYSRMTAVIWSNSRMFLFSFFFFFETGIYKYNANISCILVSGKFFKALPNNENNTLYRPIAYIQTYINVTRHTHTHTSCDEYHLLRCFQRHIFRFLWKISEAYLPKVVPRNLPIYAIWV